MLRFGFSKQTFGLLVDVGFPESKFANMALFGSKTSKRTPPTVPAFVPLGYCMGSLHGCQRVASIKTKVNREP